VVVFTFLLLDELEDHTYASIGSAVVAGGFSGGLDCDESGLIE
jgi:hypothetical protein